MGGGAGQVEIPDGNRAVGTTAGQQCAVGVPSHGVVAAQTRRGQHAGRGAAVRHRLPPRAPQPDHLQPARPLSRLTLKMQLPGAMPAQLALQWSGFPFTCNWMMTCRK